MALLTKRHSSEKTRDIMRTPDMFLSKQEREEKKRRLNEALLPPKPAFLSEPKPDPPIRPLNTPAMFKKPSQRWYDCSCLADCTAIASSPPIERSSNGAAWISRSTLPLCSIPPSLPSPLRPLSPSHTPLRSHKFRSLAPISREFRRFVRIRKPNPLSPKPPSPANRSSP